jgi:hypothetical protein
MPDTGRRIAAALSRALDSTLGQVIEHARSDVADPYLIRVSRRAWDDIGLAPPGSEPPREAVKRSAIVRKLYDRFSDAASVNTGTRLKKVPDPAVFRIRADGWRAAVRYIPEDGVVWMCRAVSLAKFHEENDAYDQFGEFYKSGELLPTDEERRLARGDQFLVSAIAALRQARVDADNNPQSWHIADARRPHGTVHRAGRILVERELVEDDGEYVTRFLLLLRKPPADVELRTGWEMLVASAVLPSDERISPSYDLPSGTNLQPGELPLLQQAIEFIDERELGDLTDGYP